MNKLIKFLFLVIVLGIGARVLAASYDYKIYNPRTNKVSRSQLMTVGKSYAFLNQGDICIIEDNMNKNESGLVGGKCHSMMDGKLFSWRETAPNTSYEEIDDIIQERKNDGLWK